MTTDVSLNKITVGDNEVIPPNSVEDHVERDDSVIVVLGTFRTGKHGDRDFDVPSDDRNVVAIDHASRVTWIIDPVPVPMTSENGGHRKLWTIQDRFLTSHTDGTFEFDPETGEILEAWPKTELPVGDHTVDLSGEVFDVLEFDDAIFIYCSEATHDLYAFESDGTERWRSEPDEWRGHLSVEDGDLWERVAVDRTIDHRYRLDPATGERLECEEIETGLW
ncbi:hypothetical protein ACFQS4_02775 [Saliphagus sp. GCM10025317]